jgi:hypothetical protein
MTSAPPPPPPPPPAVPPAGGPSGSFDPKTVNVYDWVIIGIGVLLFLFSFFAYYSASVEVQGRELGSDSTGGWHFGELAFIGWFAFIIGLASAVLVALKVFVPTFKLPVPTYVAAIGGFLVSFVLYLIGAFVIGPDTPDIPGYDISFGPGFSYIVSMIAVLAGAVIALIRAQQTNTPLPGPLASLPKIIK